MPFFTPIQIDIPVLGGILLLAFLACALGAGRGQAVQASRLRFHRYGMTAATALVKWAPVQGGVPRGRALAHGPPGAAAWRQGGLSAAVTPSSLTPQPPDPFSFPFHGA